jgi:predicted cupin superfamily sugar epimerase
MPDLTAQQTIDQLGLQSHPEGGYLRETYRSDESISAEALPDRYGAPRLFWSCIYFMLTPDTFSEMHRLKSDEIYHFYLGGPVEMLQLSPDGSGETITIGPHLLAGMRPQILVFRDVWQGSFLASGGRFALLGCTVAPGFDFADFEQGKREELVGQYPAYADLIAALTRV